MSDVDGDSQIRSSDEDESEVLFPSANEIPKKQNQTSSRFPSSNDVSIKPNRTSPSFPSANEVPTKQNQTSSSFPSGLSPPASQEAPDDNFYHDEEMDLTGGENVSIGKTVGSGGPLEPHADPEQEPGHPWMNKKAKDEYKRALEQVLDKNFSLREFGDFLEEKRNKSENKA